MTEKMRSCVMGLLLGQFSSPLPMAQKEPVAYLYNGVRLPKLPEWDREKYPYAYITVSESYNYTSVTLRLYQSMFTAINADWSGGWELLGDGDDYSEAKLTYKTADGIADTTWSDFKTTAFTFVLGTVVVDGVTKQYRARICTYPSDDVVWSNHSFSGPNGEDWITASEPIPVYE